jgi:hypothetical protein
MLRKVIIALVAGSALAGAVYGAAASLGTITGQNIAASDTTVVSCDSNGFDMGYVTSLDTTVFPAVQRVDAVTIDSGLDPTCGLATFRVRLTSDSDGPGPIPTTIVANTTFVIPAAPVFPITFALPGLPSTHPLVSSIDDAHWTQES